VPNYLPEKHEQQNEMMLGTERRTAQHLTLDPAS
jgi:hypothetical protein